VKYQILQPPFTLEFEKMNKKEASKYFNWFQEQIPIRTSILRIAVQSTTGFEHWNGDFSPDSLGMLGKWYAEQIETRKKTVKEIEEIYADAPDWFREVDISNQELTNKTFSIAFDVGVYLSQVFIKNVEGLSWTIEKRKTVNQNQPVLKGFVIFLNPIHIAVTTAYGLADETYKKVRLKELYYEWKKKI